MTGRKFMFHDASGVRGPYTAHETDSPIWFCMMPDGVEIPKDSEVFRSGGMLGLWQLMQEYGEDFHKVGWASQHSLFQGLRPGLHGPVGWVPVS